MAVDMEDRLEEFIKQREFFGQGPLCVALVVTDHARNQGLPLDPEKLVTKGKRGGGQVSGLGKVAVQKILKRHGIERVLAAEGGRTSRGSLPNMRVYVEFLNGLSQQSPLDLDAVETFWVGKVREFFASKPLKIKLDASHGLRAVVRDVLNQAEQRQKESPGVNYVGAVLQHLVGAKLDCALGPGQFEHNNYSTADAPSGRVGDFFIGDVAIHVTTAPGEGVIKRCHDNINDGLHPIIVTVQKGVAVADGLANNKNLGERIDVFEVEQFIALNLYELGKFVATGRKTAITDLVDRYNEIVNEVETDHSMKIDLRR